ncbi:MAG TPA: hypothetical protein VFD05_02020 [Bacilli bacterium]|nr:hypothetical protein [Bacilli bacterium]
MKKLKLLPIMLLLLVGITSCDNSSSSLSHVESSNSSTSQELKSVTMMMSLDYGFHIPEEATLLIDYANLFFNPLDYDLPLLVAGDIVVINYRGELIIMETYPGTVDTRYLEIISIEVEQAVIVEFEIRNVPAGETEIYTENEDYQSGITFATEYVVAEDGSFKSWEEYPAHTKLYGTNPVAKRTDEIVAFYDYNLRP